MRKRNSFMLRCARSCLDREIRVRKVLEVVCFVACAWRQQVRTKLRMCHGMMRSVIAAAVLAVSQCVPEDDLVSQIPGFPPAPFRVFSGYLNVPGPLGPNGGASDWLFERAERSHHHGLTRITVCCTAYDSLTIHYQFHECISSPASAPVVTWHQGTPALCVRPTA